jgi:hypothetical protein
MAGVWNRLLEPPDMSDLDSNTALSIPRGKETQEIGVDEGYAVSEKERARKRLKEVTL